MQKFIQTYIIFKERVILRIVKLFFHNNLTDSIIKELYKTNKNFFSLKIFYLIYPSFCALIIAFIVESTSNFSSIF